MMTAAQTPTPTPHPLPPETEVQLRHDLATRLEHAPLDALILALRQTCATGLGVWLVPEQATDRALRPATHLVEISIFGAQGTGLTVEEAARNWRRAALNLTEGDAE